MPPRRAGVPHDLLQAPVPGAGERLIMMHGLSPAYNVRNDDRSAWRRKRSDSVACRDIGNSQRLAYQAAIWAFIN